jgi:hypothetical protein
MTHIGIALLHKGKPTGQMKALCGALVSSVVPTNDNAELCPRCKQINDNEENR